MNESYKTNNYIEAYKIELRKGAIQLRYRDFPFGFNKSIFTDVNLYKLRNNWLKQ